MRRDRGPKGQADDQSPRNAARWDPVQESWYIKPRAMDPSHQGTEDGARCRLLPALQHLRSQLLTAHRTKSPLSTRHNTLRVTS